MKKEMLTKLWQHLLSLDSGFCLRGQKRRINLENGDVRCVDLEMYNRKIHSTVLIKVSPGASKDADLQEMQRMVEYYNKSKSDLPAVGIIINTLAAGWCASYVGIDEHKEFIIGGLRLDDFRANKLLTATFLDEANQECIQEGFMRRLAPRISTGETQQSNYIEVQRKYYEEMSKINPQKLNESEGK
jgi:hypothetical protein